MSVSTTRTTNLGLIVLVRIPLGRQRPVFKVTGNVTPTTPSTITPLAVRQTNSDSIRTTIVNRNRIRKIFARISGLPVRHSPSCPVQIAIRFCGTADGNIISRTSLTRVHRRVSQICTSTSCINDLIVSNPDSHPARRSNPGMRPTS